MNRIAACCVLLFFLARSASAQEPKAQAIASPDERFKADILLVVAHPDDEGAATPYLARAIYDEHKRVAVVFTTRGGSGGNDYLREPGPAPAGICGPGRPAAGANVGLTDGRVVYRKGT